MGVATLCDLVLRFGSPSATMLVDCLGKSVSPTGIGQEFEYGYHLQPVRIGNGAAFETLILLKFDPSKEDLQAYS